MTLLAIDIGNTTITCGIFKDEILSSRNDFKKFVDFEKYLIKNIKYIDKVLLSSVVPEKTQQCKQIITNIELIIIDSALSNLPLLVETPESVGADRLCNIKAAIELYELPCIVIDFGTAITYDVVNNNKEFIGGVIAPGVETSAEYLINKAALLTSPELKFPNKVIGINTIQNIQSGIMFGAIDQVYGMINRITKETKLDYSIILTGGISKKISTQFSQKHIVDINLTLKGILFIYKSTLSL